MTKRIFISSATILSVAITAFFTWDSPAIWERTLWYICFGLAITLIVIESINAHYSDRTLSRIKVEQSNAKKYGKFALWNIRGSLSISNDFCLPGELTGWAEDFLKDIDSSKCIRYDDDAIAHYKSVIEKYPQYPFPYYILAEAFRLRGEAVWHEYAQEAIRIFEITTSLPEHSPDHDQALSNLKEVLPKGG